MTPPVCPSWNIHFAVSREHKMQNRRQILGMARRLVQQASISTLAIAAIAANNNYKLIKKKSRKIDKRLSPFRVMRNNNATFDLEIIRY